MEKNGQKVAGFIIVVFLFVAFYVIFRGSADETRSGAMKRSDKMQEKRIRIKISSQKVSFTFSEPIPIWVEITNQSDKPVAIPTFGGGKSIYFGMFVLDFLARASSSEEDNVDLLRRPLGPIKDASGSVQTILLRRPQGPIRDMPSPENYLLKPLETWKTEVDFSEWFRTANLPAGNKSWTIKAVWDIAPLIEILGEENDLLKQVPRQKADSNELAVRISEL